ncbi:helix-turn-helix domain-containing protein [Nonomuraea composti]|uniref:helix-turn-helix domain-containing protein n=1 Tax=Nonomuraea composti TaxID=2720023 RepID=UPI003D1657DD
MAPRCSSGVRYRSATTTSAPASSAVTSQVRLQHARLLLATCPQDVTAVAHRVGYDSPSRFSREYRRQYGLPPSRDAARLQPAAS